MIFICDFPVFKPLLYRYTFRNRCIETGGLLGDGTCKIFLSTKGTNLDEVPRELLELLQYIESPSDEKVEASASTLVHSIHWKVKEIKRSRSEENRYMLFEELLEEERAAVRYEGQVVGRNMLLELISAMTADGWQMKSRG